jgi:hypothetical protein
MTVWAMNDFFNGHLLCDFLSQAVGHYEKTAPTVAAYLDDLYIRCNERTEDVRLCEITAVRALYAADGDRPGTWESPCYAANRIYKLMHRLGMDTTGQAGF